MPYILAKCCGISIHALRGEGDLKVTVYAELEKIFQSTPSVGRATRESFAACSQSLFQSTPSVGRATFRLSGADRFGIRFQSTPSVGRATTYWR